MARIETDVFGARVLPDDTFYGIATSRAAGNFDISEQKLADAPALIRALARIKSAAALANAEIGVLEPAKTHAITQACDEIVDG
ncbi:MAG: hypothetical protein AAGB10_21920 [Pseudomonadota bacterium]